MGALPTGQYCRLQLSSDDSCSGSLLTSPDAALLAIAAPPEARQTPFAAVRAADAAQGGLLFAAPYADDTATRCLTREMTDVFALAGGVATTIFERPK